MIMLTVLNTTLVIMVTLVIWLLWIKLVTMVAMVSMNTTSYHGSWISEVALVSLPLH
jgi:hypothetical protein